MVIRQGKGTKEMDWRNVEKVTRKWYVGEKGCVTGDSTVGVRDFQDGRGRAGGTREIHVETRIKPLDWNNRGGAIWYGIGRPQGEIGGA